MLLFRRRLFVAAGLGFFAALLIATVDNRSPKQLADPVTLAPAVEPIEQARVAEVAPESRVGICELLSLAAQADPSLQYAAERPASDITAVVALQRDLLLAGAKLLGPGPEAEALTQLAEGFAGDTQTWSDAQWADAVVARADPALVATLADIESGC